MIVSPLYTAILDACVLYPIAIADALVSMAAEGLFTAKWTVRIEEEWMGALERQRPDLVGKLGVCRDSMREAIQDWEVPESAWGPLVPSIHLPDPNDAHVLAAAIACNADYIVTFNLKDFPRDILNEHGIILSDPDSFIIEQWDMDPIGAILAFKQMRARRKKPRSGPSEFADILERAGLPMTANKIRMAADLI